MYLRMVLRSRPVRRGKAETDRPSRARSSTMTSSPSLSTDALPPATMAGGWTPKGSPVTGGHMPKVAGPRRQPGENSGALFEEYSPGTDSIRGVDGPRPARHQCGGRVLTARKV